MIALLQRVAQASVTIDGRPVAGIGRGLLVFVGVARDDGPAEARRLAERVLNYRVFPDEAGKMNLSVVDVDGSVLLVPQFTLVADTQSGNRPSFSTGADPEVGRRLFGLLAEECARRLASVETGRFGADMQVGLVNDGPVTFWLEVSAVRNPG